ncbi:MAG: DNA-binding transcriptional MerR regulator [Saprospiraceae bacterium]
MNQQCFIASSKNLYNTQITCTKLEEWVTISYMREKEEFFPIRVLTERTGVGSSTLRAWERRYGLLKPQRTPKGHRLYCEQDVESVQRILVLLNGGHSISSASRVIQKWVEPTVTELSTQEGDTTQLQTDSLPGPWQSYLSALLQAVSDFSTEKLDSSYNEASSLYPIDLLTTHLIVPALEELGKRWKQDENSIAEEHYFSAWLRNKLGARLHHNASLATGPKLVVCCAPGHRHEMGALLFALSIMGRGYRVVYLGADMPLKSLEYIVNRSGAKAVVVAAGIGETPAALVRNLAKAGSQLKCPLFVGGSLSISYREELLEKSIIPLGEQLALATHLVVSKVPVHNNVA